MPTHPDSVVSLLQEMVRINTINFNISGVPFPERPLAEYLERLATDLGFATRRLPLSNGQYNLLVTYVVDPAKPWLMFESHMDTVAVDGMIIPPFAAEIRDGKIWGRGSCDTKGTGAAMLWALHQYARSGAKVNNIAIAYALDEESMMTGVRGLVQNAFNDFKVFGVIVGEPTLNLPIVAHNGSVRWKIMTKGVAVHSSNPSRGRSAISAMCRVIDTIETHYIPNLTQSHPSTGKSQASINLVKGGSAVNIIPCECEAVADRRIVPGEDQASVLPAVEKVLDVLRAARPDIEVTQQLLFSSPPMTDANNADLTRFVQRVLTGLGMPNTARGEPYATDAGDLSAAGIPSVVLGPGSLAQAHTKDEFIEISQLHLGVSVYQALMATPAVAV